MSELPDPLVSSEIDLRGFNWMPMFFDTLFKSETWIKASSDGKIAALRMWWHAFSEEVPSGSLPNDETLLAEFSGYGVAPKLWAKLRKEVMRNWVLCSDGRLYHPFMSEKVVPKAWRERQRYVKSQKRVKAFRDGQRSDDDGDEETPQETRDETRFNCVSDDEGNAHGSGDKTVRQVDIEPSGSISPVSPKRKKSKTQIPTGWEPGAEDVSHARGKGYDDRQIDQLAEQFRDRCARDALEYADWHAAWRTSVGKDIEWNGNPASRRSSARPMQRSSGHRPQGSGIIAAALEVIAEGEFENVDR